MFNLYCQVSALGHHGLSIVTLSNNYILLYTSIYYYILLCTIMYYYILLYTIIYYYIFPFLRNRSGRKGTVINRSTWASRDVKIYLDNYPVSDYNHIFSTFSLYNINNNLFNVLYPIYIMIRVQWTIYKMGCKLK